jgi:DNA polymerase
MTPTAQERREGLVEVYREARVCERCPLSATRNTVVFGSGDADADLMFIGEGPGAEEDRQGLPFVGRAGRLLTELLSGIGMTREDVWITNVIRCRPPGNRDPHPEEIESCRPFTERQFALIEPKVVATLGNFATKLLTGNPTGITRVRGTPQEHSLGGRNVVVLPLLHPASALRNPSQVDLLREDFRTLVELLGEGERSTPEAEAGLAVPAAPSQPDQLDLFG